MPENSKCANTVLPRFISSSLAYDVVRHIATVFLCFSIWAHPVALSAIEISDTPLETAIQSPTPNVMLVLDNSGSMDWEFMTEEGEGLFQEQCYLFPEGAYHPSHDHHYTHGRSLTPLQRRLWKSQWAGYNRIYFDPRKSYSPWPDTLQQTFEQADLSRPLSNPLRYGKVDARIDLTATYFSVRSGTASISIANAHYFTLGDINGNGVRDSGERIYLVAWVDEDQDGVLDVSGHASADRRHYYRYIDDGDDRVEDDELLPVLDESEKDLIRPTVIDVNGGYVRSLTDREALQNFANWCTYYRKRILTLKAVTANTISNLSHMNIGLCAVNGSPRIGVQAVEAPPYANPNQGAPVLLNALYAMQIGGLTPLRSALDSVGHYFRRENSTGFDKPLSRLEEGGACQRHYAVLVSDGFWNGQFSGCGNVDGNNGSPFADSYADTLADVAAHYYETDLRSDLEDAMPAAGCSTAVHQHMITLALSFGLNGTIAITDINGDGSPDHPGYREDPCFNTSQAVVPIWPRPIGMPGFEAKDSSATGVGSGERLDDLWHATVNGHGAIYSMTQAMELQQHIRSSPPQVSGIVTAAALTLHRDQLTDSSILYRTSYDPVLWHGELSAWAIGENANGTLDRPLWRASDYFQASGFDWDQRRVVTYGGDSATPLGIPFRYENLSEASLWDLKTEFHTHPDATSRAQDLIAYVRGANFPHFRERTQLLGDMVHSKPVVVGNTVFVGANDGMLHAFNALNGQERFAYVPHFVFGHLKALSDRAYPRNHQFYVDGPLWAGDVVVGPYQRRTYLVGGLGKGGRGYFCLKVGARQRSQIGEGYGDYRWNFHVDQLGPNVDEFQVGQVVQWEYPRPDTSIDGMDNNGNGVEDEQGEIDPQMGYSFGQGYAVNANCADDAQRPVVIFGNGYDSPDQSAVLYILTADTGVIIRKIHTGAVGNNGLSTPALVDVNRDNRIDYAYAGDLQGNMWKFDLKADDPNHWGVAFGEDRNGDHVIDAASGDLPQPLFQALNQPITGRPDIMTMANSCNPQAKGYMVIFGTGRYLDIGDPGDTGQQSIYGIWDYGDDSDNSEYLGFILDRTRGYLSSGLRLVPQRVTGQIDEDGVTTREVSQLPVYYRTEDDRNNPTQRDDPKEHVGWFLDFPVAPDPMAEPGERVISRVTLRGGKAVVPSIVPQQVMCRSGGSSWIYVLNACDGSQPETKANVVLGAKKYKGRMISKPMIVKDPDQPRRDQILIPDSSGGIIQEAFVGEFWGRAYWWQNIE